MKKFNNLVLLITVSCIDLLYGGREIQRFWVLETVARAPYFAFLSVLHFRESMGLRTHEHFQLMKEHFHQTVNETEHLIEMENRGGADNWLDRLFAHTLVLFYYWVMVLYYALAPISAYHLNAGIELHATESYLAYFLDNPDDLQIAQIAVDEINHYIELTRAMNFISK